MGGPHLLCRAPSSRATANGRCPPASWKTRDHRRRALRETREEANARVELGAMFTLLSVPHISQVHVIYRARLLDLEFARARRRWMSRCSARRRSVGRHRFRTIAITLSHYLPTAGPAVSASIRVTSNPARLQSPLASKITGRLTEKLRPRSGSGISVRGVASRIMLSAAASSASSPLECASHATGSAPAACSTRTSAVPPMPASSAARGSA